MGNEIKSGAAWLFTGNLLSRVMNMASMIVLARLLVPSDFGLIALANVTWELLAVFFSSGLLVVIVQAREDTEEFYNTAFLISLTLNLMLVAAAVMLAPLAASYYHSPDLVPVLRLLAATYAFNSLSQVQVAKLKRELRFDVVSRVGIANQFADSLGMMVMAFMGAGYWSLVIPKLALAPIVTLFYFFLSDWRPGLKFSRRHAGEIVLLSFKLLLTNLLNYVNMNADFQIVGKLLGQTQLGLYRFAYNLAQWPIMNVTSLINNLSLPYFAGLRDQPEYLRTQYLKMTRISSITVFPIFIGAAMVAPSALPLVFGPQWAPSIIPFQLICLFGLLRSVGSPGGSLFLSHGRAGTVLLFNFFQAPILIAGLLYGVNWGINGIALLSLAVLGAGSFVFIHLALRAFNIGRLAMIQAVEPALVSVSAMATLVYLIRLIIPSSSWISLASQVLIGGVVYVLIMRLHQNAWTEYLELGRGAVKGLMRKDTI